jgi:hypothetical protein
MNAYQLQDACTLQFACVSPDFPSSTVSTLEASATLHRTLRRCAPCASTLRLTTAGLQADEVLHGAWRAILQQRARVHQARSTTRTAHASLWCMEHNNV